MAFSSDHFASDNETSDPVVGLGSRIAVLLIKASVVVLPLWVGFLAWGAARLTGWL